MITPQPRSKGSKFRYLKNKYVLGTVAVVLILLGYFWGRGSTKPKLEVAKVTVQDVIEKVSVTGKISAVSRADLAFEKGGAVAHVYKNVGDHVMVGDLIADLDNSDDQASLASAQAKLEDISRALRPEEFQLEQARVESAKVLLNNAQSDGLNASRDAYVKAQAAIINYADTFFANPQSPNPTITVRVESVSLQTAINNSRLSVTDVLNHWKNDLNNATTTNGVSQLLSSANAYVTTIKSFMDSLAFIANRLSPGNSGLSQGLIDTYVSNINLAQSGLNQAINSVTAATTALSQAQASYAEAVSNFDLKSAGSSAQAIKAQQATVDALKATVNKGRIYSPINGIVTKSDPKPGEFVSVGQTVFAVMSDGLFKIEAYVPEADIAKVVVGDKAGVTLDAYGSDVDFPATVKMIDPAETIIEGVPTYKVTLMFDVEDSRIRSGMTANTDISTNRKDSVLALPTRAIIDVEGKKMVRIVNPDGKTFVNVPVKVGLRGSNGISEIVSGVKEGDIVVTYTK